MNESIYLFIYLFIFMANDNTSKFLTHVSTETSVILSWLLYKVLQVEFISRKEC